MTFRTSLKHTTIRAAAAALGLAFSVGSLSAQTFSDLAYSSPANPEYLAGEANSHDCRWSGEAIGPDYAGATWSGFAALDLQDYLFSGGQQTWGRCFVNGRNNSTGLYGSVTPQQSLTGYQQVYGAYNETQTNVVAIGATSASFSRNTPFTLESMLLGAGWGNVSELKVTGRLRGQVVWNAGFSFLGLGGNTATYGNTSLIDEVIFSATYSSCQVAPALCGGDALFDPYNSVGELEGYGYADVTRPYQTFFVDNIVTSTVPEPSSFALVAGGLLGLAGVVRRRRQGSR